MADQLFLRLADVGPGMVTAGDQGFVPMLARSWTRRDSLTLVFDLDPRARWHDGAPVTSRDVLFTLRRARDSAIAPRLANVTRRIASVEAEGEHRVVFRFREVYAEQFYDATFHTAMRAGASAGAAAADRLRPGPSLRRIPSAAAPIAGCGGSRANSSSSPRTRISSWAHPRSSG